MSTGQLYSAKPANVARLGRWLGIDGAKDYDELVLWISFFVNDRTVSR